METIFSFLASKRRLRGAEWPQKNSRNTKVTLGRAVLTTDYADLHGSDGNPNRFIREETEATEPNQKGVFSRIRGPSAEELPASRRAMSDKMPDR
jgi:hypothetical protein